MLFLKPERVVVEQALSPFCAPNTAVRKEVLPFFPILQMRKQIKKLTVTLGLR